MSDDPQQRLAREGLLFFGSMGAGLSHEVNNVFNIINELTGLQQDIIKANADGGGAGLARVADLAGRIKSQVIRGEEINRCLHSLSHSVDNSDTTFDLGENLALFGLLAAREARLAEVELTVRPPASPIEHHGDPFALLVALHCCVMFAIGSASSERRIELWVESGPGALKVVVSSADPLPDLTSEESRAAALETGCAALTTAPHIMPDPDGGHRIVLSLDAPMKAATTGV